MPNIHGGTYTDTYMSTSTDHNTFDIRFFAEKFCFDVFWIFWRASLWKWAVCHVRTCNLHLGDTEMDAQQIRQQRGCIHSLTSKLCHYQNFVGHCQIKVLYSILCCAQTKGLASSCGFIEWQITSEQDLKLSITTLEFDTIEIQAQSINLSHIFVLYEYCCSSNYHHLQATWHAVITPKEISPAFIVLAAVSMNIGEQLP